MRVYADTSFVVKLVTDEPGSEAATAEFRRLDFPPLFFSPLHALEVTNAIRQRAFHLRRSTESGQRTAIARERDAALARIERWLKRGWLIDAAADCDNALLNAQRLSHKHTERLGCRGFDLLHVALALELESEAFLTSDRIQGAVARAEGLVVTISADE
ncbi:MAG TPA: type II toxin-antitoxin system VapC family toxin [Verrucomicrobiae bacterium]|jgi:predicted nucleic acid-binding protein|nr:type II toxin-antitoxin system VapC family toxin [Verrucomicrobiae bacterium]